MIFHFSGLDPKNHQLFRLTKTKYPKRFDRQKKCFYISQGASQASPFPFLSLWLTLTRRILEELIEQISWPSLKLDAQLPLWPIKTPTGAEWNQIDISRIDSMSIFHRLIQYRSRQMKAQISHSRAENSVEFDRVKIGPILFCDSERLRVAGGAQIDELRLKFQASSEPKSISLSRLTAKDQYCFNSSHVSVWAPRYLERVGQCELCSMKHTDLSSLWWRSISDKPNEQTHSTLRGADLWAPKTGASAFNTLDRTCSDESLRVASEKETEGLHHQASETFSRLQYQKKNSTSSLLCRMFTFLSKLCLSWIGERR